MKANLYQEAEQAMEPVDESRLAIANEKPSEPDVPEQKLYVVDYKTMVKPSLIALAIFVVWAVATWLL
ncbi:MAG: hypothetical protein J6N71_00130 [Muribaculaceae bacterium]|nr:hypothetical protein [Muribaculaceae bacterium]HAP50079.1 hypothetical protein [Porphyromonadaceae bacterium]